MMIEDKLPRGFDELTGRHRCIGCLADVPAAEYFANDFMCGVCAAKSGNYPLASTPEASAPGPGPSRGEDGGSA